jgi:hypothetical protein
VEWDVRELREIQILVAPANIIGIDVDASDLGIAYLSETPEIPSHSPATTTPVQNVAEAIVAGIEDSPLSKFEFHIRRVTI